jgi:hypothetical protein
MLKIFVLLTLTSLLIFNIPVYSQFKIMGIVTDSITNDPVYNAKAEIFGKETSNYTDARGQFSFKKISPGLYTITISKTGYLSSFISFLVDSSGTHKEINIRLQTKEHITDTINVRALYFKKTDGVSTSFMNAEYEEIRKSPGAMEDVIRYFTSAPGVSLGNDINNEIIVRGGSPVENLTLIDGLEIQNPNHYGAPGSTNGVLSYINLKLVKDVDFFSGGFPSVYGDKLSGVMDIKFREGSRHKHIRDLNISAVGFGGFFEGPITKSSSYMFSARRSYYELIKDLLNTSLIPEYWDFNTKLSLDVSKNDKLSVTGLFATDNAKPIKAGDFMYDTIKVKILSTGFNYIKSGEKFIFKLTAGYGWNLYKVNYSDFVLDINDNEVSLKQELSYGINKNFTFKVFTGARYFFSDYIVRHGPGFNASNFYSPAISFDQKVKTYKLSGGFNIISYFFKNKLILNTGIRFDSFRLIEDNFVISPRFGLSYKITSITTFNANAGIYYQAPEMLWVLVDQQNRNLKNIRVEEIVLGLEHYFSFDTKLSIEPYLKQYYNYPVSVYDPNYIFINSGVELYPNFLDKAVSAGEGYFTGVDITIQKKNPGSGLYGTISYSFSRSRFKALAGEIQQAEFDYGNQITVIAGYKLGFGLSLSGRFKFAKGRPYTPYNSGQSAIYDRGIYDMELYNKGKMPDYARLDLRVDKNFKFSKSELIIYVEVLNVFNRVNYYNYYWSTYEKGLKANLQFPRVPILGVSFRF